MNDDKMEHSQAPGSRLEPLGTGEARRASPQEPQFGSLTNDETDALIREIEAMTDAEIKEALVYERNERASLLQRKAELLEEREQLEAQLAEAIVRGRVVEAAYKERDAIKDAFIEELQAKGAELDKELAAKEGLKTELTKKLGQLIAEHDSGRDLGNAAHGRQLETSQRENVALDARVEKVEEDIEKECE